MITRLFSAHVLLHPELFYSCFVHVQVHSLSSAGDAVSLVHSHVFLMTMHSFSPAGPW